jgi:uncharacterized lipoprotein YddW (UPF0748 family)
LENGLATQPGSKKWDWTNNMTDFDTIRFAQEFVVIQLQKAKPNNIDALNWRQEEIHALVEEIKLTVYSQDESFAFTFTEKELTEDYGTKKWEKRLNGRVKKILAKTGE